MGWCKYAIWFMYTQEQQLLKLPAILDTLLLKSYLHCQQNFEMDL